MIRLVKMTPIMEQASGEDFHYAVCYIDGIDELENWCDANCRGVWYPQGSNVNGTHVAEVVFTHKADAAFFKLSFS